MASCSRCSCPRTVKYLCPRTAMHSVAYNIIDNTNINKTELSLMPSIHFQNSHDTGVGTLVSMATKRIELLIGQKMTKHVAVIS